MTGLEDFNFPAFHSAATKLRALGMVIKTPAESESDKEGMPDLSKMPKECGGESDKTLADVRHADYLQLLGCESIILLPGWRGSKGALSEYSVARLCGMSAYCYFEHDDSIELVVPLEARKSD